MHVIFHLHMSMTFFLTKTLLFNLYSTVNIVSNYFRTLSRFEQTITIRFSIHANCIGQASCCLPVLVAVEEKIKKA